MELDKRILEGKKPLDCFDTEIAKRFIGKKGFFGTHESQFMNLDTCPKCVVDELKEVDNYDDRPFTSKGGCSYRRFLPVEWVKEPKKKYRPFSLEEFFNIFEVGDLIVFKMKNTDEVKCAMFTGYITDVERIDDKTPGAVELMLGIFHYSLFSLFEDFELFFEDKWQPFGKECEE